MKLKMALRMAAVAAIVAQTTTTEAISAGDHEHLFLDLCALISFTERKIPDIPETASAQAAFHEIIKLNSSLSESKWRKQFDKQGQPATRPKYKAGDKPADPLIEKRWNSWTQAEDELEKETPKGKTLAAAGANTLSETQRRRFLALLQPIAETAADVYSEIQSVQASAQHFSQAAIKAELNHAVYGAGVSGKADLTTDKLKAANGNPSNRGELCGAEAPTTGKAVTITAILYCVCEADNGEASGSLKACADHQTNARETGGAITQVGQATTDLIGKCPGEADKPLTPTEIVHALARFEATKKTKAKYITFGTLTSTGCNGSSTSGLCVVYKTPTATDAEAITKAPWRKHLLTAAELLNKQARAAAYIETLTTKLTQLKNQAFNQRAIIDMQEQVSTTLRSTGSPQKAAEQATAQRKKEQCEVIEKAEDCKNNGNCKWQGPDDKGTCKLDESKVATQANSAGTGAGEGAAGTNTNTTTSKSFVIKKAPLLLAVLLF
uniref:Variant surface glycoprotein 2114 n=1 Tax=Trypanosoma brucei TaxID=5691 RepID=M4TDZ9_9TRYP|nr:variant surface glycoprotein 2114 [Trypanosoma brucei]